MRMAVPLLLIGLLGWAEAVFAQPAAPHMVQGRILTDGAIPVPLRGARVIVLTASGASEPVHSDADGRFRIAVPDREASLLRVTKAGFAPREATPGDSGRPLDIHMTRGAALDGQVVGLTGEPAPGVFVVAAPAACRPPCRTSGNQPGPPWTAAQARASDVAQRTFAGSLFAETDDRGRFRFGSLPAGRYELRLGGGTPVVWSGDPGVAIEAVLRPAPLATVTLRAGAEAGIRLAMSGDLAREMIAQVSGPTARVVRADRGGALVRGGISGPSGRPVAGAVVALEEANGNIIRIARSDARGRYVLPDLPAGWFSLTVFRAGLPAAEQQRPLVPGRALALRAGDTLELDIEVPRGHAISGRVVDAHGEPLEGLLVQAWQQQFVDGRAVLEPATVHVHRTDDRGHYRIHGLVTGTYYVVAHDEPPEAFSSRVTVAPIASRGVTPGAGRGAGEGGRAPAMIAPADVPHAPLTFYPGRPFLTEAVPVRIRPGMDLAGVDLVFTPTPGARVEGTVIDALGRPVEAAVSLVPSQRSDALAPPLRVTQSASDGRFAFVHVPPGNYVVQASVGRMSACRAVPGLAVLCDGATPGGTWQFGTSFVQASGTDAVTATVQTSRGSSMTGHIVLEGGDHASLSPADFALVALPVDRDTSPAGLQPRTVVMGDGRFTMTDLHGTVRLASVETPAGWYLQSMTIDGIEAVDRPVTFGPGGTRTGVEVTFSAGGAEIHGRVVDDGRAPVANAAVVVFPADAARWHDWSRSMVATGSGESGHFVVTALPPGEYWVAAFDRSDAAIDGDWRNPEVLHRLTAGARRVTVRPGSRASTEVRPFR
jgi:hypothetical protein